MSKTLGDNIEWELAGRGGGWLLGKCVVVSRVRALLTMQQLVFGDSVSTLGSSHRIFLFYDLKNKIDVM